MIDFSTQRAIELFVVPKSIPIALDVILTHSQSFPEGSTEVRAGTDLKVFFALVANVDSGKQGY